VHLILIDCFIWLMFILKKIDSNSSLGHITFLWIWGLIGITFSARKKSISIARKIHLRLFSLHLCGITCYLEYIWFTHNIFCILQHDWRCHVCSTIFNFFYISYNYRCYSYIFCFHFKGWPKRRIIHIAIGSFYWLYKALNTHYEYKSTVHVHVKVWYCKMCSFVVLCVDETY
jgi:hypothetical protein